MAAWIKDPDATLDYAFDWSGWLADEELIDTYTVTVDDGLTIESDSQAAGVVTVWLSGGTVDATYKVACRVTTNGGRTDDRTTLVLVRER